MYREDVLARFQKRIPVLDQGFVELLDLMGDDEAIEEAARVSYEEGSTRKVSDMRGLLRYLLRHRHTTPFEMVEIKVRVKLPIFVERQWVRHRMASTNEMSARYSELPEEFYVPPADQVCHQDRKNKQGRAEPLEVGQVAMVRGAMRQAGTAAFATYHDFVGPGVDLARETARCVLPLSTYTEKVWKIDGHNLLHFLSLRLDAHAQWEIRQYAEALASIVREWLPLTWEAFVDYRLQGCSLSRMEVGVLRRFVATLDKFEAGEIPGYCREAGMSKREIDDFVARFVEPVADQFDIHIEGQLVDPPNRRNP